MLNVTRYKIGSRNLLTKVTKYVSMGNREWVAPPSELLIYKWPIQTNTERACFYRLKLTRFPVFSLTDPNSSGKVNRA